MKKIFIFILIIIFCIFIYKLQKKETSYEPINLNKNHICASDEMIIINYNGPKAQIIWKDGSRSFYCEVREAFYESLDKVRSKFISNFYVQDFSNIEWGSYTDKWVPAKDSYFVVNSQKLGAMGLSYVPFSDIECAKKFKNENGGDLLSFKDISKETILKTVEILEQNPIY